MLWFQTDYYCCTGQNDDEDLPDVGHRVVDQLQCWNQEVFVEVFSGENLGGSFTNIKEPQAVPVAATLSQI